MKKKFSLICVSILVPIFLGSILTSCSSSTIYTAPFSIGGYNQESSPFYNVFNNNYDNNRLTSTTQQNLGTYGQETNPTKPVYSYGDYIPSNYIFEPKTYAAYSYSAANDIDNDLNLIKGVNPHDWNLPLLNQYGTNDLSNQIISYRNYDINTLTSTVNNNSVSIKTMDQYCLNFLTQSSLTTNIHKEEWYNALFGSTDGNIFPNLGGGFSHGDSGSTQNDDFSGFILNNVNVFNEGTNNLQYSVNNLNYNFASSMFGPGPMITSSNVNYTKDDGTPSSTPIGGDKLFLSGINAPAQYKVDGFTNPYLTYTLDNSNQITLAACVQVPVLIKTSDINFNYVSFTKNNGFKPDTWRINDYSKISNAINNSPSWKKEFKKLTNKKTTEWQTKALQWNFKNNPTNGNLSFNNKIINNSSNLIWPSTNHKLQINGQDINVDYCLNNLYSKFDGTPIPIQPNDYIGFANYAVNVINQGTNNVILQPTFTGMWELYPVWTFLTIDNNKQLVFDTSLLKKDDNDDTYMLDNEAIYKKQSKHFANFYQSPVPTNLSPWEGLNQNQDINDLKSVYARVYELGYMHSLFGTYNTTSSIPLTNSTDFISPIQY